jgi:hypothetical protein
VWTHGILFAFIITKQFGMQSQLDKVLAKNKEYW